MPEKVLVPRNERGTAPGNFHFRIHWEHRRKGKLTWYLCAAPSEVLKPSQGTCDAPEMFRHRLAHRAENCDCKFVSYAEGTRANIDSRTPSAATRATQRGRRRIPLSDTAKRAIRLRARNRCEACGRPLQAVYETKHREQWSDRVELAVYDNYPCRRCGFPFPVVDAGWLQDDDLGRRIGERFPAFYPSYSKTFGGTYWANHCPSCHALQGGFFVEEYGIGRDPDEKLVIAPWKPLKIEGLYMTREKIEWGHIHHVDRDLANNALSNLRLLCVRCHAARHRIQS